MYNMTQFSNDIIISEEYGQMYLIIIIVNDVYKLPNICVLHIISKIFPT